MNLEVAVTKPDGIEPAKRRDDLVLPATDILKDLPLDTDGPAGQVPGGR